MGHLNCLAGTTYPILSKFSFNFDFFPWLLEVHCCSLAGGVLRPAALPPAPAVRRNRARALIPYRDSDADFGTRLSPSLARAGPTRRLVVRHTRHRRSRCRGPGGRTRLRPRALPGSAPAPALPRTALFGPGSPAPSVPQGIRGLCGAGACRDWERLQASELPLIDPRVP